MLPQYVGIILSVCTVVTALTGEEAITRIFEYFEKDEPVGVPVLQLEEPADLFSPLEAVPITLTNGTLYGHSMAVINAALLNFVTLTGKVEIFAPYLEVNGHYSWPSIFVTSEGESNTTLIDSLIQSNFSLIIDENEDLLMEDINIDIFYEDIDINMTDLLWEQELLLSSGLVHTYFNDIFGQIFQQFQPYVLGEVNKELRKFVSTLPRVGHTGPLMSANGNFSTPEYQKKALALFFKKIMTLLKLDPVELPIKNFRIVGVNLRFSGAVLHGASNVKEIERLIVIYKDNHLYIESAMTYHQFRLGYMLGIQAGSFSNFAMPERVRLNDVKVHIKMSIDPSRKTPPKVLHLGIDVGSFGKIRTGKKRHFLHKMFKNLFDDTRNEIVKALAGPLKKIIQNDLNKLDLKEEALTFLRAHQKK